MATLCKVIVALLFCAQYVHSYTVVTAKGPIPVEVGTRYVTNQVQHPTPGLPQTFVASTCKQFIGDSVNVTVLLTSNPRWLARVGVVHFYIVDDPKKPKSQALCTNDDETLTAVPSCLVRTWNSTKDLYVMTQAGDVAGISFSVNVKFIGNAQTTGVIQENKPIHNPAAMANAAMKSDDLVYLIEIVQVTKEERLRYNDEAILNVSFCPNKQTTDRYTIASQVVGTDQISSYTQYICTKLPCEVDNPNVISSNPSQLMINSIDLPTTTAAYQHLYVLLVSWGGNYDPAVNDYVGDYQYIATITPDH